MPTSWGLEIGPLHTPLIRRSESRVLYVDYASTETLRDNFRHPGDPGDIVDVDIVWGDRPLRDCVGGLADYVVASHVIEHVPDLIGWLLELRAVLKVGGVVGLAVPDRRYTFDVRRPVSLPGEIVEAYLRRHRQPSLRQVFDAAALSRNSEEPETWRAGDTAGGLPAEVLRRLVSARDMVMDLNRSPRYVDAHCWVFTPSSFLDTAEALHCMGYFPFEIAAFHPTEAGAIEFIARLRAVADAGDGAFSASLARSRAVLAAVAPEPTVDACEQRMAALEAENAALRARIGVLTAESEALRRSRSWRLTAPMRAAMRLLGR